MGLVPDCVGVSRLRSEGNKEVFLAIQVDGVTRARTALLALRGPALSLNHAFHLELERARQLRMVVLTPGKLVLSTGRAAAGQTSTVACNRLRN